MPAHLVLRSAAAALILALVGATLFTLTLIEEQKHLAAGLVALHEGNTALAAGIFHTVKDSMAVGNEAHLGLAVCSVLLGQEVKGYRGAVSASAGIERFGLPLLIRRELGRNNSSAAASLARLYDRFDSEIGRLWHLAFRVDDGMALQEVPEQAHGFLQQRFSEGLRYHRSGDRLVVRDRSGDLIGRVDAAGHFHTVRPEYDRYLQGSVVHLLETTELRGGVRLSIDLSLSRLARSALGDTRGSIVLIDPYTGGVLAAVSDDRTLDSQPAAAFRQQLEPASISKLITTVAALRAGVDPEEFIAGIDSVFAKRYQGGILYNPARLGPLSGLDEAMAGSCNIAFADLGVELGWQHLVEELRNFGFDASAGNPFPLGNLLLTAGSERQLADLSIGLEHSETTPAHAASIAATFVEGIYRKPVLLHAEDGILGLSPRSRPLHGEKILTERAWLKELRDAMIAVSGPGGTARWIDPEGFQVAMKTGTGGNYTDGFHVNYIGIGPLQAPRLAWSVRVTHARRSHLARREGWRTTRQLLQALDLFYKQRSTTE